MQYAPAKRDEMFKREKNVPPKWNPGFMKVKSLLGKNILLSYKQIL